MQHVTLEQLNQADVSQATQLLQGIYQHAPAALSSVLEERPFQSLAQLKYALAKAINQATPEAQLALVRSYRSSTSMARMAQNMPPEELERLQRLGTQYQTQFGFPFVLALCGPRNTGVDGQEVSAALIRRQHNTAEVELAEALRNIHRIAEVRLNKRFAHTPELGNQVWDWQERLAQHSDPGYGEKGQLTVTYLTDAHRACAQRIHHWMHDCGFDLVEIDAVGNVVGRYYGDHADAPILLTGSHYDTVRNGGKYDGRLGIFVPMACVSELHRAGKRLPFAIEVVGFAEEEGQRYQATFLGSSALVGDFKEHWLDQKDADGISMRAAMQHAGLCIDDIGKLQRDPRRYLGFIEVHIEQGPVLNELDIPLGVVTSINGSVRYACEMQGTASHAGTTPMDRRRDAAVGVAELALYVEKRAAADGDSVGTIGQLEVPSGSTNVVPGRCTFSLDLRAPSNEQRDALASDVLSELDAIAKRRGLRYTAELSMQASAAPSAPVLQQYWENAVHALGVPVFRLPSGAGHDAMQLHRIMPQAMLFVRGINGGISHNPLECSTNDDMQLAVEAFTHLLGQLAQGQKLSSAHPNNA